MEDLEQNTQFLRIVKERFREARNHAERWREDAEEDYDFVAGEQWTQSDKAVLEEQLRPVITFNRVQPIIEAISGSEISNRQEVRFIPREMGDVQVNEIVTGAAKWARDMCDAEDEESDAFFDCIVCGMGWTETRLCYEDDPDGNIIIERVDPLEMYWDPAAKKRNLSDARWVMRIREVTRNELRTIWPDADIDAGYNWLESAFTGLTPHDATEAWKYENDQSPNSPLQNRIQIVEYQWWQYEPYYRVYNPMTQQIENLSQAKFERIEDQIEASGMQYVRMKRRAYYRLFAAANQILELGPCPCLEDFTYKCITGKRDRNKNLWYGIVRSMKDPQRWANKFFSQILHIINANAKGGLLAEEDAFVNPQKAEEEWARPDSITMLNPGALMKKKVEPKPPAAYPVGVDRMMEFAISSLRDVSGVNLELLGLANREQPGILEAQRKQAGLTILGNMFNSLRRYRKEQGRVLLFFIKTYISDGRLIRINGSNTQGQYVPLVKLPDTYRYDIIVDDAPTSPNMKEQVWGALSSMMPFLAKMGAPIPPDVLDYLPFPSTLIEKWKAMMVQAQQPSPQAQLMQKKLEADVALAFANAQKIQAETQRTGAQVGETQSKSQLNVAKAQAEQNKSGGQNEMMIKAAETYGKHMLKEKELQMKAHEKVAEHQLKVQQLQAELAMEQEKLQAELAMEKQKLGAEMVHGAMEQERQDQATQADMAMKVRQQAHQESMQKRQQDHKEQTDQLSGFMAAAGQAAEQDRKDRISREELKIKRQAAVQKKADQARAKAAPKPAKPR